MNRWILLSTVLVFAVKSLYCQKVPPQECRQYPYCGMVIKCDTNLIKGTDIIYGKYNGNNFPFGVEVAFPITLVAIEHALLFMHNFQPNMQIGDTITITMPLVFDKDTFNAVKALLMASLPVPIILGSNAFRSIGTAYYLKHSPPGEFIVTKNEYGRWYPFEVMDLTKAFNYKGVLKVRLGQYKGALPYFELYQLLQPDSIYGHHWSARCHRKLGRNCLDPNAVTAYQRTLDIAKTNPERFKEQGLEAANYLAYHYASFDLIKARQYLQDALTFDSTDTITLQNVQLFNQSRLKQDKVSLVERTIRSFE